MLKKIYFLPVLIILFFVFYFVYFVKNNAHSSECVYEESEPSVDVAKHVLSKNKNYFINDIKLIYFAVDGNIFNYTLGVYKDIYDIKIDQSGCVLEIDGVASGQTE